MQLCLCLSSVLDGVGVQTHAATTLFPKENWKSCYWWLCESQARSRYVSVISHHPELEPRSVQPLVLFSTGYTIPSAGCKLKRIISTFLLQKLCKLRECNFTSFITSLSGTWTGTRSLTCRLSFNAFQRVPQILWFTHTDVMNYLRFADSYVDQRTF